jgi:hypothetical protein
MKMRDMKNLLFIVLLVAVLITAGCTGGNQNPVVTPTPQIVYVTVLVTPIPTTAVPTALPTTGTVTETVTVTPDQSSYQTYTNNEFKFSIQHPKNWTASGEYVTTAGGGKKYKVIFDDPTFTSMQYVTITPDSAGLYLEDWANIFLKQVKSDPAVGVVGQYPLEIDGNVAKKLVLTNGVGNDATESTIIMTVKGNNAYFMEFTSRKDQYPSYSQDVDGMIKTFRFT